MRELLRPTPKEIERIKKGVVYAIPRRNSTRTMRRLPRALTSKTKTGGNSPQPRRPILINSQND
jgi:hypothetical protein